MKIGHKSFELNIKKLLKCHIWQCSMCKSQAEKQTNKHTKKTASAVDAVFFVSLAQMIIDASPT